MHTVFWHCTGTQRVTQTLRAAAVDEEARELLKRGRLTGDLQPQGFEAFARVAALPPEDRAFLAARLEESLSQGQFASAEIAAAGSGRRPAAPGVPSRVRTSPNAVRWARAWPPWLSSSGSTAFASAAAVAEL